MTAISRDQKEPLASDDPLLGRRERYTEEIVNILNGCIFPGRSRAPKQRSSEERQRRSCCNDTAVLAELRRS